MNQMVYVRNGYGVDAALKKDAEADFAQAKALDPKQLSDKESLR